MVSPVQKLKMAWQNQKKEQIENVSRIITQHANKIDGLSNEIVHKLAKILCPCLYKGFFNWYELTNIKCKTITYPFTIIVNTVHHFVTIHSRKDYILYLDSYGQPCTNSTVRNFLRRCKNMKVLYNTMRIQSKNSMHCGLYALLFAMYYDDPSQPFLLKFSSKASKKNDKLCVEYLQRLCKQKYNVYSKICGKSQ